MKTIKRFNSEKIIYYLNFTKSLDLKRISELTSVYNTDIDSNTYCLFFHHLTNTTINIETYDTLFDLTSAIERHINNQCKIKYIFKKGMPMEYCVDVDIFETLLPRGLVL